MIDEPAPPPSGRARGRIELLTAGFFLVLAAAAVAAFPPVRDRIVETARSAADRVLPATWAAYYLEIDPADPAARSDPESADAQLMFASGSFPGTAARLLSAPIFTGTWSPNGERFVALSGSRVFMADRDGRATQLTELRDLRPTGPPIWNGDDELLLSATRTGQQHWMVRLDSRTGTILDQRDLPIGMQPYAASPDGRWMLALDLRTDSGVLVELASGRRIEPAQRESFAAWMSDGRILAVQETDIGSSLVARRPEGGSSETLLELDGRPLLPAVSAGRHIALVESQSRDGMGARAVWLITTGQSPVRVARGLGRVYFPKPSRDGRFVGISEVEEGTPLRLRTGVIEVATGKVTYACDTGCAVLDVR
jgi:hypothetical protein